MSDALDGYGMQRAGSPDAIGEDLDPRSRLAMMLKWVLSCGILNPSKTCLIRDGQPISLPMDLKGTGYLHISLSSSATQFLTN